MKVYEKFMSKNSREYSGKAFAVDNDLWKQRSYKVKNQKSTIPSCY